MTVRLSDQLGLDKIADISLNLGIYKKFPPLISSSLGSLESSLVKITSAYATLANQGIKTTPVIIGMLFMIKMENIFIKVMLENVYDVL